MTTAIPNFKEVIIMATVCDACGFKSNEVKSGTGINEMGTRIELHLTDISDLSRDILKVCVYTAIQYYYNKTSLVY